MEQGTDEWLQWRKQGVGGSEVAAILGKCPYKTELQLWREKRGKVEKVWAQQMHKGHEVENQVRAAYEFATGMDFPPALMEAGFMRVSLDGWNAENKKGIEIKYCGLEKMEQDVPEHHMIQMQYQMFVAGVDDWTYIRSNDGITFKATHIKANPEYQKWIVECVRTFWHNVQNGIEPSPCERDWVEYEGNPIFHVLLDRVPGLAAKERDHARRIIFDTVSPVNRKVICHGWKIDCQTKRITKETENA